MPEPEYRNVIPQDKLTGYDFVNALFFRYVVNVGNDLV
jgi:hypothetical protein